MDVVFEWRDCGVLLGGLPFEAQAVEDAGVGGALIEWHC